MLHAPVSERAVYLVYRPVEVACEKRPHYPLNHLRIHREPGGDGAQIH